MILEITHYIDDNGGVTFNTSTTTCISTMPWHTGSTDKVKGTCGSPYSNTNGKEPFKFLGIEFALGQYVVRSDVILNGVYDAEADTYQQEIYTCYDCNVILLPQSMSITRNWGM